MKAATLPIVMERMDVHFESAYLLYNTQTVYSPLGRRQNGHSENLESF